MNQPVIPIADADAGPGKPGRATRGRAIDAAALQEIRSLLGEGEGPRRRELLIEHLHKIQDRHGHLPATHLAALAQEMRLAHAVVFEVASFSPHFDVVRAGGSPRAAVTVRVCDGLSCAMAGADDMLARLPALLGKAVRVVATPAWAAANRRRP